MTNSFSKRHGISNPASLNPKDMPVELRNRLWNITQKYIEDLSSCNGVIENLWDRLFKEDGDALRKWHGA